MVIYSADKATFIKENPKLPDLLEARIKDKLGEETSINEKRSWMNSLSYMRSLLDDPSIPDDAGIALEYNIPITNNRIDFLITGIDEFGASQVIVVELKQWSYAEKTDMDGIVRTVYEDGIKDTTHPSYQALTYCMLLHDYKESVQKREVHLKAVAYLHNCTNTEALRDSFYDNYTKTVPVFGKLDADKLRAFIVKYIRKGDQQKGIFVIEDSQIKPSKNLMDSVANMMKGNKEFRLIGDQKVVLQRILRAIDDYDKSNKKQVLIIEGGPGTGKSVIAINALHDVISSGKIAMYVSKNANPRNVFYRKLVDGGMKAKNVNALFKPSVAFGESLDNDFDMLLVDEAHRLSRKSGLFNNIRNQVFEIINAAKVSVFFIDEAQIVSMDDIGTIETIKMWGEKADANITHLSLKAQFRCGGSDGYLQWLDNLLEIKSSSFKYLTKANFDFRIYDNPSKMMKEIKKYNMTNNRSRMVAGYCWEWKSMKNKNMFDIQFPEYKFSHQWNLFDDKTWSISPGSIDQIGCIHTCQGLEFDYVGVIIGPDIIYRDGKIMVDPSKRAPDDYTIKGYKKMMKESPDKTKDLIRRIIKNTYRTLMSRGMKGCFVYVVDNELKEYINSRLL